jgi:integrase
VLQYKTAKTLKPWTRPLPDELINILKRSLSARKRKYVFAQSDGEAFKTRNSFTQFSNRVLKHTLGENITVNSLRHAYASYRNKLALTLKQRQMDAMDMGHSLETHLSYAVDGVNNKTITLKRFKNSSKKS